jgi:hypothetical protein
MRASTDRRIAHRRGAAANATSTRTAYPIAQALWGNVAVTQAYLTLSEVLGHIDRLSNEGRACEVGRGDVSVFEAS